MMPSTTAEDAEQTAWRIRDSVKATNFAFDGLEISVTVSLGVAQRSGEADDSLANIIDKADTAMYAAKAQGKNLVVCYDPAMGMRHSKEPEKPDEPTSDEGRDCLR